MKYPFLSSIHSYLRGYSSRYVLNYIMMNAASLTLECGLKYTFIKLELLPSFGLTDTGPREEEARIAWETVMHDIYFLGGLNPLSDTWWGRITGTENEVMIMTGIRGYAENVAHTPLISSNLTETTPNILSPLTPYLLHSPIIINIQWQTMLQELHKAWSLYCDLNLFHIRNANEELKDKAAQNLGWRLGDYDSAHRVPFGPNNIYGNLFQPEGRCRSFVIQGSEKWLEDYVTLAHLTLWKNRDLAEAYKDPTHENEKWCPVSKDWYQNILGQRFAYVVEEWGLKREEIQVGFKKWMEVEWEDEWEELKVKHPAGCIPTHKPHGKECEKCEQSRMWMMAREK